MSGSTATREQAMDALLSRLTTGPLASTWQTSGRRLKLWQEVDLQPALFLVDRDEQWVQRARGMPQRLTLTAQAVIYARTTDAGAVPATVLNGLLQLVDAAMQPDDAVANTNTLGGLVSHCWIEGRLFKDPGDVDGQAIAIVPLNILLP